MILGICSKDIVIIHLEIH